VLVAWWLSGRVRCLQLGMCVCDGIDEFWWKREPDLIISEEDVV